LDKVITNVGDPLLIFSAFGLLVGLSLLLASERTFRTWLKFAAWWILLSVIFIATTAVNPETGGFMQFYAFTRDDAARLMGALFALISLAIIAWSYFKSSRHW
jgi:hypothetical protein